MLKITQKQKNAAVCSKIVSLSEDSIIIFDKFFQISLFNTGAENTFGYKAEEVLQRSVGALFSANIDLEGIMEELDFSAEGVPFMSSDEKIKHLPCLRKNGTEFDTDISLLRIGGKSSPFFAMVIRVMTEGEESENALLRLASTDPLTGVFNRREFVVLADRESQRVSRYDRPLSIVMLGMDGLKKINEDYGHEVGDRALIQCAEICSNTLRNVDILCRWGDDVFVALLPETELPGAAIIAERLRFLIETTGVELNGEMIETSVSVGATVYKDVEKSPEKPIKRAHTAMYEAKEAGGNALVIYREK